MPEIKKLKVSFDLDANVLMRVLAENNIGFTIEAYASATSVPHKPTFLEAMKANKPEAFEPLQIEDKSSLRNLILARLRHTGRNTQRNDLLMLAENNGFTNKALGNMLFILKKSGMILNPSMGVYRISKRHA